MAQIPHAKILLQSLDLAPLPKCERKVNIVDDLATRLAILFGEEDKHLPFERPQSSSLACTAEQAQSNPNTN